MFFDMNNTHPKFQHLFLIFILILILLNFITELPFYINYSARLKHHSWAFAGREFLALIPYLKNVPWAGYLTCVSSSDPRIDPFVMGPYQQAQFILSPTILDFYHPYDYTYIIVQCPDNPRYYSSNHRLATFLPIWSFDGFVLLSRKKGLL